MWRQLFFVLFVLAEMSVYSQDRKYLEIGVIGEQNLKAIAGLTPYTVGGLGFDNRYEGIKGSPRMLDTLLPSFLKVKGQDYYIQLEADLDLINNILIFVHPKTRKLLSIPSEIVDEVVINKDGKELFFRTARPINFEKDIEGLKFYQVLREMPVGFIKMPVKIFVEADYKGLYSSDRRYDEFKTVYRYYLMGTDSLFHQVQLNRKSFLKLYPSKKSLIESTLTKRQSEQSEYQVLLLLDKF